MIWGLIPKSTLTKDAARVSLSIILPESLKEAGLPRASGQSVEVPIQIIYPRLRREALISIQTRLNSINLYIIEMPLPVQGETSDGFYTDVTGRLQRLIQKVAEMAPACPLEMVIL